MTALDAMLELLARMGANNGAPVQVSEEELSHWPDAAVKAMKSLKLLMRGQPASSAVCPGCEEECVMLVHTLPAGPHDPASFIVCDKRSDINRVAVAPERLKQWQCDIEAACRFIAQSLGLRPSSQMRGSAALWVIGLATGNKRSQMLCLKADGELTLVAGNNAIPLAEFLCYHEGAYSMDSAMIRQLVNAATTGDSRYSPSDARREARKLDTEALHERWRKQYRALKQHRPGMSDVWYSQQIAKTDVAKGRSFDTIRKHMKR